ncbi:hypothetical protein RHGRI_014906 [Rhododendron griersonianum]|uniref:Uncharacterized protein n=1 Tax=Rhododendron griersonianum TaxID=479676 RepID=A0AAV6KB82_9ERIC|nr:hypothetical protein RHGRI_014906 [Rhododendron griersonianum]
MVPLIAAKTKECQNTSMIYRKQMLVSYFIYVLMQLLHGCGIRLVVHNRIPETDVQCSLSCIQGLLSID